MFPWQIFQSFLFLLFLLPIAISTEICPVTVCSGSGVAVKFPFQLTNSLASTGARCLYPGFELSCLRNETILWLPNSGPFIVKSINYDIQTLYINDPENCLAKRFLNNFSLGNTQFYPDIIVNFTFLNCTSNTTGVEYHYRTVPCLSGENYKVLAVNRRVYDESKAPSSCRKISSVLVPVSWAYWNGLEDDVRLTWSYPSCAYCEDQGQACGFKSDTDLEIGCFGPSSSGISRGTKYGIIIGIGMPGTLCILGLGCYICSKVGARDEHRRRLNIAQLSTSIAPLAPPAIAVAGLARPTIESYPKTLLGESGRLPKPNDNTCPICLCEYQPGETLRTIPDCNHYFHADCVDKWLRMNASCPLCRNSPEGSASLINPSSTSTSSRSSLGLST